MVQKALKLFLLGLLLWPVLINLVGFVSPLWGLFVLGDGTRSNELLRFFQPYVPLVSILFAISLLLLSKVDGRPWMKGSCWIVSLVFAGCSIYGFLPEETPISYVLHSISAALQIIMLFLGGLSLLHILSNLTIPDHFADGVN
jgi:hypothetical protein